MKTTPRLLTRIAACAAIALAASAAQADTYQFTITGDYSASWQMESMPSPLFSDPDEDFGVIPDGGIFANETGEGVAIAFYHDDLGGGIEILDLGTFDDLYTADGPQVYMGAEAAPTFKLGTFALDGTPYGFGNATLTITNLSAVPEPESYAMLLAGLGALGFAAARRRPS